MRSTPLMTVGTLVAALAACNGHADGGGPGPRDHERLGHAIAVSDTTDLPDAPLQKGFVLFVRADRLEPLAKFAGVPTSDVETLRRVSFEIEESDLESIGGISGRIDSRGRFPFSVDDGRHLVCLANIFPDHAAEPPYAVVGCSELSIPRGPCQLRVTFGEGGVEASREK